MAIPAIRFRQIPQDTAEAALDTAGERLSTITGEVEKSTGTGQEADFGVVDISEGAANSGILTLLWDVDDIGGNTLVENFKLWLSTNGFDQAGSVIKMAALSGADQVSPSLTANYVVNAIISSYTFTDMPEAEPGSQNMYPSDEGSSMDLSGSPGTSDDVCMWAMYAAIAADETTGSYYGLKSGFELQYSFKFSYS